MVSGSLNNRGQNGVWWSSTENDASNAWNMGFNSDNANGNNGNNKNNEISVRLFVGEPVTSCFTSLAKSIINQSYTISPSICFIVDYPVKREIIAANFRDHIVHHYIHSYINPHLERILIFDSYSCRKHKGTSFGIDRLEHHILSSSRNYTRDIYILQLDIKGYFMYINRIILYDKVLKLMEQIGAKRDENGFFLRDSPKHKVVEYLLGLVIFNDPIKNCIFRGDRSMRRGLPASKTLLHSPPNCGLPIGNLTSQLFSNLYLNAFDHYVKRDLGVKHYGRYVDDFYLIDENREVLKAKLPLIESYLRDSLSLELHPSKIRLQEVRKGVSFLGVHLKPYRRYLHNATKKRIRTNIYSLNALYVDPCYDDRQCKQLLSCTNSYLGVLNSVSSFKLRCKIFHGSVMFKIARCTLYIRKFMLKKKR